jgi:riboflavin synthase
MFTGLIEEVGAIADVQHTGGARRITVRGALVMDGLGIDDSIAIDGCCQTVVERGDDWFTVVAVEETLKKTTFGDFIAGRQVNLERALRVGDRLGGHFVQGHVDCVGTVSEAATRESSWIYWISYPEQFADHVISVGSIAINGVSLTAAEVDANRCMVSIIPHTYDVTTFNRLQAGDTVNVEFDMIGKYIRNFVPQTS